MNRREPTPKRGAAARLFFAARDLVHALREDRAAARAYAAGHDVEPMGLRVVTGYRVMRFLRDAGVPVAPKIAARLLRHAYGADIHWQADIAPGVVFVHGVGIAISFAANIERGAIVHHHVTVGASVQGSTHAFGAPTIGEGAHLAPGVIVTGPITVGARSRVDAHALVRASVPPDSIVAAPPSRVAPRPGVSSRRAP